MTFARFCLFCLIALTCFITPSQAAINKEGAEKLKTMVNDFITEQKKLAEISGKTKVEFQGETTVEEAGEYYAVTLPYTKIIQANGEQVDIGMVSINASPGDNEGQWKMRVAVPTPIVVSDKAGAELVRMTIGGQRAAGIWDESLRSFIKLDALYKDVFFIGTDGSSFKIPETQIIYDFTKDAANKWSGPGSVTFKNIEAVPKTGGTLKIAEVKADFSIDQYDSNAIRAYREKLAALSESMTQDVTNGQGKISPAHTAAVANMMADFITSAGNGMKIRYNVTGLNIARAANTAGSAQNITIPKGFLAMDLAGFSKGSVRLALQLGYDGLLITPAPEGGLTPTEANVDIVIENIPMREILDLGKNTIDATLQQPAMSQVAGAMFIPKLLTLLSQSGAFITVDNTHMGNADVNVKLEGRARADISAIMSATANSKVTFRGLDTLIERLKAQEKIPGQKNTEKLHQTIQKLEMFKAIAKVETQPGGSTLHIVEYELTPQGKMTINGQDARAVLFGEKPAEAAPVPPVNKAP